MRVEHDRITLLCCPLDRRWRVSRNPHGRMRLLKRLRQQLDVFAREILPMISQALILPGGHHDFDRLAKTRIALLGRHAKGSELARIETAPCSPVNAAARKNIE